VLYFSQWSSYSTDCAITNYELYDADTVAESVNFDPAYELIASDSTVKFGLRAGLYTARGDYSYLVRVTADNAVLLDEATSYSFSTICGARTFTTPDIDAVTEWPIDNTIPTLRVPQFPSYSGDCSIGKYQLYSADLSESPAFETTYDTLDGTSEIQFSLLADLRNVKAAYTYIVRASEITDSTDVIFEADN